MNIAFVEEKKRLGTAGAIKLAETLLLDEDFLVVNCDVVTQLQYSRIFRFHVNNDAMITVGSVIQDLHIPFGVLSVDGLRITKIVEKPRVPFNISAGIYALNSNVLRFIKDDQPMDMPELVKLCLDEQKNVLGFGIHEYWADVGTMGQLEDTNKHLTVSGESI